MSFKRFGSIRAIRSDVFSPTLNTVIRQQGTVEHSTSSTAVLTTFHLRQSFLMRSDRVAKNKPLLYLHVQSVLCNFNRLKTLAYIWHLKHIFLYGNDIAYTWSHVSVNKHCCTYFAHQCNDISCGHFESVLYFSEFNKFCSKWCHKKGLVISLFRVS